MTPVQQNLDCERPHLSNPCLIITPDHKVFSGEAPIPTCKPNQVKIHIKCTGICGSDIHLWKDGGIGDLVVTENLVLGHEASGQIIEIGSEVTQDVSVGDRVAIEPQVPCGKCYLCLDGHYNLCTDVDFLGVPPTNGSMQRFLCTDAKFVHKLPDSMSYEQGALAEVVSVACHGVRKAGGLKPGNPCMIAGCGPIGLATLLIADVSGAFPIVVSDICEERLNFAKELIPSVKTYKNDINLKPKENAANIRKLFGTTEYVMPPVVLECTGFASSINTCCYVVRRNGVLTILGVSGNNELDGFPFMPLSLGEVDVRFINRYTDTWPAVINLIASGKINVDKFVSHTFLLENAPKALECVVDSKIPSIKVMIKDDIDLI